MKHCFLLFLILVIMYFGCTSSVPDKVYEAQKNSEVTSYFSNGIPIAVLLDDSLMIMAVMKPEKVAGTAYIRLWLLYGNKMESDFLLAPLEFVKMTLKEKENTFTDIKPESPTKLLAKIEDEKVTSSILTSIGGALQTLSSKNTKLYDENNKEIMTIGDREIKNEYILQKTKEELKNTIYYYDIFKESINQGILRRNTLFTDRSVNGYIYFSIYDYYEGKSYKKYIEEDVNSIIFEFYTPVGTKKIEFKPIKGE